jgi:hypothetical protein
MFPTTSRAFKNYNVIDDDDAHVRRRLVRHGSSASTLLQIMKRGESKFALVVL